MQGQGQGLAKVGSVRYYCRWKRSGAGSERLLLRLLGQRQRRRRASLSLPLPLPLPLPLLPLVLVLVLLVLVLVCLLVRHLAVARSSAQSPPCSRRPVTRTHAGNRDCGRWCGRW